MSIWDTFNMEEFQFKYPKPTTLTVALATRGRPEMVRATLNRTLQNVYGEKTKIVVLVDDDDKTMLGFTHEDPRVIVSIAPREDSLGEKYNRAIHVSPAEVYLAMVDYAPHVTQGFDKKILEAAVFPDGIGVVYNHMENLSFPQINAVTHRFCSLMGTPQKPMMYPAYFPYWFVDHWLDDIARMTGRITCADIRIDTSKRPGTMEQREPKFWALLFDMLILERREIAKRVLDAMFEMPFRKWMQERSFCLVEERSLMLNQIVRGMAGSDQSTDERYQRIRANAVVRMQEEMPRIEREGLERKIRHLNAPEAQQHPQEIGWLLEMVRGAKSVLEIGSCFGHTLKALAGVSDPNARIASIDLGRGLDWLEGADTGAFLKAAITEIALSGRTASCFLADSKAQEAKQYAADQGPLDVLFIDGDHSYEGAKADWDGYRGFVRSGGIVAFHDIAHPDHQVSRLWAEIKASGYETAELVKSNMGIGIVRV